MPTSQLKQKFKKLGQLTESLLSAKEQDRFFAKVYKKKLKKVESVDRQKDEEFANKLIS